MAKVGVGDVDGGELGGFLVIRTTCRLDKTQWHKWYAWHPVWTREELHGTRYCHTMYWLMWLERRRFGCYGGYAYEHRLPVKDSCGC